MKPPGLRGENRAVFSMIKSSHAAQAPLAVCCADRSVDAENRMRRKGYFVVRQKRAGHELSHAGRTFRFIGSGW
jgi:hypothetical protein